MTCRVLPASACWPVVIVFALLLSGCGAKSVHEGPAAANITGNWELTLTTTNLNAPPAGVAVFLTSNAGNVSGMAFGPAATDNLCAPNGCCGGPIGIFDEEVTGTVDADGNLKLANSAAGHPVFAMTGTVAGQTISNGSFAITNGSCSPAGTATGTEYLPLNGSYAGSLTSEVTGQSFPISAVLTQNSTPNADGYLSLAGTVTMSGYPCMTAGTPLNVSSSFVGDFFDASAGPSAGATFFMVGMLSPDEKTLTMNYGFTLAGSPCNGDGGSGTLTLQVE